MNILKMVAPFVMVAFVSSFLLADDIAQKLQDISVTIKSGRAQGSGVIITRELKRYNNSEEKVKVNFVWTAGHVVDDLRSTRTVIDSEGVTKKVVEFKPAFIVKELVENGRRVGEINMEALVVKYSDADNGEDLALLMVRKLSFVDASVDFYLEGDMMLDIGTNLYHVGSLLGQTGANSMTSGIISQVGRVLGLGNGSGVLFDQTTVTAFPGSSGGGVFLADGEHKGKYMGMLVRGAGETFNLVVPVRRMHKWAEDSNLLWALNKEISAPSLEDIYLMQIENSNIRFLGGSEKSSSNEEWNKTFPFLIGDLQTEHISPFSKSGKVEPDTLEYWEHFAH